MTRLGIAGGLILALTIATICDAQEPRRSGVGMPLLVENLVLPGTELEVAPGDRKDPLIVRIVQTYKHGTAFRYDIEFYGLDAGTYDLGKYLKRKDGTPTSDLPKLPVTIVSHLPAGQITPNQLPTVASPWLGGYRLAIWAACILWVVGLVLILVVGRGRRSRKFAGQTRRMSFADRLRPLVEKAQAGQLTQTQRAELERTLLAYWRDRLDLGSKPAPEAFAEMRRHPQAGPLLSALETWLHRPGPSPEIDVNQLLEPYRNLPESSRQQAVAAGRPA